VFPDLPEFGPARRTQCELDVLGYALGQHPVDVLWQGRRTGPRPLRGEQLVPCGRLDGFLGKRVSVFGWAVAFRRHRTERGEPMAFVTIEDGTGIVEGTLFPKVFQACGGELQGRGPFVVSGVLEERLGGVGLRVTAVRAG
jgi:DNA polymerase III alpha subunit